MNKENLDNIDVYETIEFEDTLEIMALADRKSVV